MVADADVEEAGAIGGSGHGCQLGGAGVSSQGSTTSDDLDWIGSCMPTASRPSGNTVPMTGHYVTFLERVAVLATLGAQPTLERSRRDQAKVSQVLASPDSKPVVNHCLRWADVPWVNDSWLALLPWMASSPTAWAASMASSRSPVSSRVW